MTGREVGEQLWRRFEARDWDGAHSRERMRGREYWVESPAHESPAWRRRLVETW